MNKFAIPTILAVTVLVAGIFAFMPVEQASTVHTTIQGTQLTIQEEALAAKTQATPATATITCNAAFTVLGAQLATTHDNVLDNFAAPTVTVDGNAVPLTAAIDPVADTDVAESVTGSISSGSLAGDANDNIVFSIANTAATGADDTIAANVQILTTTSATCTVT